MTDEERLIYALERALERSESDRKAAEAQRDTLAAALIGFKRADLKGPEWPTDWLGPCFCLTTPARWPGFERRHEQRCLDARAALAAVEPPEEQP